MNKNSRTNRSRKLNVKKIIIGTFILSIVVFIIICFVKYVILQVAIVRCEKLYANEIIKLPDNNKENVGFTCTGLYYDKENNTFLIGNAGKYKPSDSKFEATVEEVDFNFLRIKNSIECYKYFENMRDIQGVCKGNDNSLWICSYGENMVRHINQEGSPIDEIDVDAPSGLAYDENTDSIWVLTNRYLYNYSIEGNIKRKIYINIKGQDQLYLDKENNLMFLSAGANYFGDSYIYTVDLATSKIKLRYVLKDSYAIEGICIVDDILYVLNDGYYHDAKAAVNQVNLYQLK